MGRLLIYKKRPCCERDLPVSKSRGNSEGKEEDGHAKVTDGEVDDKKLGRL